jgi:hypothetical protein
MIGISELVYPQTAIVNGNGVEIAETTQADGLPSRSRVAPTGGGLIHGEIERMLRDEGSPSVESTNIGQYLTWRAAMRVVGGGTSKGRKAWRDQIHSLTRPGRRLP